MRCGSRSSAPAPASRSATACGSFPPGRVRSWRAATCSGSFSAAHRSALSRGRGRDRGPIGARQRLDLCASHIGGLRAGHCGATIRCRWRLSAPSDRPELRLPRRRPGAPTSHPRVLGPQRDYFTDEALAALLDDEFRISKTPTAWDAARRSAAVAIAGAGTSSPTRSPPAPSRCRARVSRSCCSPTIRRPAAIRRSRPSSRPILPLVGRRRPGDAIRFAAVTVEGRPNSSPGTPSRRHRRDDPIAPARARRRPSTSPRSTPDNLISGVVTAVE